MFTILVPIDFSNLADTALNIAATIVRKTGGEITLLHVIEASYEKDFSESSFEKKPDAVVKSEETSRKKIAGITEQVKYAGIRFNIKIKSGNPSKHLSDMIVREKIDLIVMGTEGTTSLFKGFLNKSKTEEVVSHADCMVLTVKEGQKDFQIRNVVFATDFENNAPEFISHLKSLQELFYFKLHILYVNSLLNHKEKLDDILNKKEKFIKHYQLSDYEFHAIEDLTEYTGITEYAEKIDADLIALTTHQKKGFWHWVGGLSEDLVNYAEKPVLTYKAEK